MEVRMREQVGKKSKKDRAENDSKARGTNRKEGHIEEKERFGKYAAEKEKAGRSKTGKQVEGGRKEENNRAKRYTEERGKTDKSKTGRYAGEREKEGRYREEQGMGKIERYRGERKKEGKYREALEMGKIERYRGERKKAEESKAGKYVTGEYKRTGKGVKRESGQDNTHKGVKYEHNLARAERAKNSRCPVSGKCGGCQYIDVLYEIQLKQKKKEVAELLKPFCKVEKIHGMEEPEHYRNKVTAVFTHDQKGNPLSGVYEEGTHYVVPVETCLLEDKKADEIIGTIRRMLKSFKIKVYDEDNGFGLLRHVLIRVGKTSGQIMVVLVTASPIFPSKNNFIKALCKEHPEITTIVQNVNDKRTSMILAEKENILYGKGYIEDLLCGKTFKISSKSFYQVNPVQTEVLYKKAIEYAGLTGNETVIDAYCGIGTIGLIAADKAKKVIGVELNKDAVKDAIINARINKIKNVDFYQNDAGEFMVQLAEQEQHIDVVFMDPPRAGSDEKFLSSVKKLSPDKVVYISCNPETLVRDLNYLVKNGYRVERAEAVDMFVFTKHVEVCCLMSRVDK